MFEHTQGYDEANPLAYDAPDGPDTPLERQPENLTLLYGVPMLADANKRPLVAHITTMLSYVYKIAKLGFDFYTLVHFGH